MSPPQEIIRLVINKSIVPEQPKRRGRKGYGTVLIVGLLVYSVLAGIFSNRGLRTHLEEGKTIKGWFEGFKLHVGINQLRVPVRAVFTTGNKHDSPMLPYLLVVCIYLLADAGYDSKENRRKVREAGGIPVIDRNPGNTGKRYKRPWLLKRFYVLKLINAID